MNDLNHVPVYTSGQEGYHTYRIPALQQTASGALLAFAEARKLNRYDAGTHDNEVHLVCKRSEDGGRTWSKLMLIEAPADHGSAANATPVLDRTTGRVWVHYLRCKLNRGAHAARATTDDMQNFVRYSDDDGRSWSPARDLTSICRDMHDENWNVTVTGPGGSAIQNRDGRLIVPCWKIPYGVFTLYSDDHGQSWQRSALVPQSDGSENQLVELEDGRILMDFRQGKQATAHRWQTISSDGGMTWSPPQPGQVVDKICCGMERWSLGLSPGDAPLIVWSGTKGPGRKDLVVRMSFDQGQTYPVEEMIGPGICAYSDLAALDGNDLGLLWEKGSDAEEANYRFIIFTRLEKDMLGELAQRSAMQMQR